MPAFTGIAAGDAKRRSAVLWTRLEHRHSVLRGRRRGTARATTLILEIAEDQDFSGVIFQKPVRTDSGRDHTAKSIVKGLIPGTQYFYRWKLPIAMTEMAQVRSSLSNLDSEGPIHISLRMVSPCQEPDPRVRTSFDPASMSVLSRTGRFTTAPRRRADVAVRFGHSGDADGLFAPYAAMQDIAKHEFDFFFNNGDTIYETQSDLSPAVTASELAIRGEISQNQLRQEYYRKYRESHQPVAELLADNNNTYPSLSDFYAAQGNFTTWDNHEMGNRQLQSGGAPIHLAQLPATVDGRPRGGSSRPEDDVNTGNRFVNQLPSFRTIQQAFIDYQPIAPPLIHSPEDRRSHRTYRLFNARQWGRHVLAVNLDTRSYRDVRLLLPDQRGDDSGARADHPDRTMLGETQLQWLKQTLLNVKRNATSWTVISTSVPIDQVAPPGAFVEANGPASEDNPNFYNLNLFDDGKSWFGGYRAERNDILRFIADNDIRNVVFLASDQHLVRVNEVWYAADSSKPQQMQKLPGVFSMVTGPMGAGGPDAITDHSYANIEEISEFTANTQKQLGVDPLGLDPSYPGLHDVWRLGNPNADRDRSPAVFHSPATFNYAAFEVGTDGDLDVELWGVPSYQPNTFPDVDTLLPQPILGFSVAPQLN